MDIKLNTFDIAAQGVVKKQPTVSMNTKTGGITVSKAAAQLLALGAGSKVSFHQDKNRPSDWYVSVGDERGIPLRAKDNGALILQSSKIARTVLASISPEHAEAHFSCRVGEEPFEAQGLKLWPLITKTAKINPR